MISSESAKSLGTIFMILGLGVSALFALTWFGAGEGNTDTKVMIMTVLGPPSLLLPIGFLLYLTGVAKKKRDIPTK